MATKGEKKETFIMEWIFSFSFLMFRDCGYDDKKEIAFSIFLVSKDYTITLQNCT